MYFVHGDGFGASFTKVEYSSGVLSLDDLLGAVTDETRLVFLANPNSPYGDWKDPEEIDHVCSALHGKGIVFMIDEAYVEFSPGSCLELTQKYDNVLISRTFSKGWGAAGCRVGYLIGHKHLIEMVSKVQLTYPVPGPSVKFASMLLENHELIEAYISESVKSRDALCDVLSSSGFDVLRSHTNTIHFHETHGDNHRPIEILEEYGLAFKCGSKTTGTPVRITGDNRDTWIRLSIGAGIERLKFVNDLVEYGRGKNVAT
jgi:histidinol-phosphate aminotransferase